MNRDFQLVYRSNTGSVTVTRLREGENLVGRFSKCALCLPDRSISRQHARIELHEGQVTVHDLASTNGTYVDNKRVRSAPLTANQEVRFGDMPFQLVCCSSDSAELAEDIQTFGLNEGKIERALNHPLAAQLREAPKRVYVQLLTAKTEKEIGAMLHISKETVHNHTRVIYHVFEVHTRAELIRKALGGE